MMMIKRLKKNNVKTKRNLMVIENSILLFYSIHFLFYIEAKKKASGKGPLKLGK
jgi:hypothetical protein